MNNTYPKNGYQIPVNNWAAWSCFQKWGLRDAANDNGTMIVGVRK